MTSTALFPMLPTTSAIYRHWQPIIRGEAQPCEARAALIRVTEHARHGGQPYDEAFDAHVKREMSGWVTPEMLERNNPPGTGAQVHGGLFGMEIYYARKAVEARHRRETLQAAQARLRPKGGLLSVEAGRPGSTTGRQALSRTG